MPDNNTPANAAPASGTGINEPGPTETFSIPKAEWESVKEMAKSANSLAAELRILRKQKETTPVVAATTNNDDSEPTIQKETVKKLIEDAKAREARIDARDKAWATRVRKTGIKQAIAEAGIIDPDHREVLETYLEQKHGSQIKVDDEDRITITDDLEQSKDIGDFIGELLKGPKGKLFKPEKLPLPNTRAGRGATITTIAGQKSILEMSREDRLKLSTQERAALYAQEARRTS